MWQRPVVHRILIAVVFFAVVAPTLSWLQFSGGMENFNVATAQEVARDGCWAVPTLGGVPRIEKPPIVHWITALGILSSHDLGWGARWPNLIVACLMLVMVYELGRAIGDWRWGLISACICSTTLLFLKFAHQASYDINLALWVIAADVCIARAILHGERWGGLILAGFCLGIAIMCKGPISLLEAVAPAVVFVIHERWLGTTSLAPISADRQSWAGPILAGTLAMLLIALPWPIYVILHVTPPGDSLFHSFKVWYNEVTLGTESRTEHVVGWHTYLLLVPLLTTPWIVWFFWGVVLAITRWRACPPGVRLMMFLAFVPTLVMEFAASRRDRYLLPMYGPQAILAAFGLLQTLPKWGEGRTEQRVSVWIHWIILVGMTVGLPLAGAFTVGMPLPHGARFETPTGGPWYSAAFGLLAALGGLTLLAIALAIYRWRPLGLVAGSTALGLFFFVIFNWGYRSAEGNVGEGPTAAAVILNAYPDADIYNARSDLRKQVPELLMIYLNRDVHRLEHPWSLAPSHRPQVLIYPPEVPTPHPPPGFSWLGKVRLNELFYQIYGRPGVVGPVAQPTTQPGAEEG